MTPKVTLDFSKVIYSLKGEPYKDMIDPPAGRTQENAPNLTIGSIMSSGLLMGITQTTPKDAFKYYNLAYKIDDCFKENDGKLEVDEGELSQFEEAWAKVTAPTFTTPLYSGAIQAMINNAKTELLNLQKNSQ